MNYTRAITPKYKGRYQAHPIGYWQAEFNIAKEFGFSYIEFILDYNDYEKNPLMSKKGIQEIHALIALTGVKVKSICADYFMEAPLHSVHQKKSEKVLKKLLQNAKQLNVVDIVIPCVDQSTLKNKKEYNMLVASVKRALPLAQKYGININFETDLNPQNFKKLLEKFDSKHIKVNYDIGNSAALGYDPKEEFKAYGEYISDVHIKDRVLDGGSVKLGTGNAAFTKVFKLLKKYNFRGNINMQAAKGEHYLEDLILLQEQKEFISKYIKKYL
ncbi:MAG: sugar phosphate isomerase/epimerase family protein [Sulfurimonas sp.]|nr:sugar phosphate isomerase/epimerase family protein [Sulfurimonas sp.]